MNRQLWLVFMAMIMFAIGTVVQFTADNTADHLLGAVSVIGALAVVVANITGNGKNGKNG